MNVSEFLNDERLTKEEKVQLWQDTATRLMAQDSDYVGYTINPTFDGVAGLEASAKRMEAFAPQREIEYFLDVLSQEQERYLRGSEQEQIVEQDNSLTEEQDINQTNSLEVESDGLTEWEEINIGSGVIEDDPEILEIEEEIDKETRLEYIIDTLEYDDNLTDDQRMRIWNDAVRSTATDPDLDEENCIYSNYDGRGPVGIAFYDGDTVLLSPQPSVAAAIEKTWRDFPEERFQVILDKLEEGLNKELQQEKEAELVKEEKIQEIQREQEAQEQTQEKEKEEIRFNKEVEEKVLAQKIRAEEAALRKAEADELARIREDAAALDRINEKESERLRKEEVAAAKEASKRDFVDEVISMGQFLAGAVKDFYNEAKQVVMDKIEEVHLAISEDRAAREAAEMTSYIETWPEKSWQRELAKELVNEGDVKTAHQLEKQMGEYIEFANNTTVAELAKYLDSDSRYSGTWQSRFISDLADKTPNQTMSDALTMTMQHDRFREQNPEIARQEDMKVIIHQIDKDVMKPGLSKEDLDGMMERRERLEKSIDEIDKRMEAAKESERARDAFEAKEAAFEERFDKFMTEREAIATDLKDIDVSGSYFDVKDKIYQVEDRVREYIPNDDDFKNKKEYEQFYRDMMDGLDAKEADLHDISVEKAKGGDLDALKGLEDEFVRAQQLRSEDLLSKGEYQVIKEDFDKVQMEYEKTTHTFEPEHQSIEKGKSEEWTPEQVQDHRDLQEQREQCGYYADMAAGVVDYAKGKNMTDEDYIRLGIARNEADKEKIELTMNNQVKRGVDDKSNLEVKVHWTKVQGYQVAYDLELSSGEKSNHSYNTFTLETAKTEAIRDYNETLQRDRERERGMSMAM